MKSIYKTEEGKKRILELYDKQLERLDVPYKDLYVETSFGRTHLIDTYGYEVKRLNEQVKRNINRFPEDFMFQIEPEELPKGLKSQIATLNESGNKRGLHVKKMPYAFTEQGIFSKACFESFR